MDIYEIIFIIAISLQLAGALVLIESLGLRSLKKEVWLRAKYQGEHSGIYIINIIDDGRRVVEIGSEELRDIATKVIRNRTMFAYIAIGYLLSIYGETGDHNRDLISIIVLSILLFILCRFGSTWIAKRKYPQDEQIKVNV